MKKIILILMLFKSCGMAYGQAIGTTNGFILQRIKVQTSSEIQLDTIPALMLVSDTSNHYGSKQQPKVVINGNDTLTYPYVMEWVTDSSKSSYDHNLYWIKGYVIETHPYFSKPTYLNENKQLIDKKTIVWLTK
jgi:hypothetical protein